MSTKTILLSFALFLGTTLLAQTRSSTKTATATSNPNNATSTSAATTNGTVISITPACYHGKVWKLSKVEKFGIEKDPGDDQKNDMVQINSDGSFKIIIKGVEKTGTYTRGSWMTLKPADGSESLPFKIEACEGSKLKADWRDGDTHNHFTYITQ